MGTSYIRNRGFRKSILSAHTAGRSQPWPPDAEQVIGEVFVLIYPFVQAHIQPLGSYGRLSVATMLGINHWFVIIALAVGVFFLFRFFERKGL